MFEGVWDKGNSEDILLDIGHREADTVHRDRSLFGDIFLKDLWHFDTDTLSIVFTHNPGGLTTGIDMSRDQVTIDVVPKGEGALQIDPSSIGKIPGRGLGERLRHIFHLKKRCAPVA
jgi:hypothetical protein